MKKYIHILIIVFFSTWNFAWSAETKTLIKTKTIKNDKNYNQFLIDQSKNRKSTYLYNPYENIISGVAAFLIGNVGYFTTNSTPLSVAYSGIQTIGIVNVGRGAYEYYRPDFEKNLYDLSLNSADKKNDPQYLSKDIVRLFAEEARAKRLALLYTSSLLATQYFANAMIGNQANSLKSIYYFLGSVNLIVVGFSYFHKNAYEEYYYSKSKHDDQKSVQWSLVPLQDNNREQSVALFASWKF
jgi:hypothetical protein